MDTKIVFSQKNNNKAKYQKSFEMIVTEKKSLARNDTLYNIGNGTDKKGQKIVTIMLCGSII